MTSFMQTKETVDRKWYVIDAKDQPLGKVAAKAAHMLRGKHKPTYTPHVDTGDYVIIINAEKVVMTGKKLDNVKYYHHSGWLGGLKVKTAKQFLEQNPTGFVEAAVKGMLPHNTLGRKQGMKLFVYAGDKHPHAAQNPVEMKVKG